MSHFIACGCGERVAAPEDETDKYVRCSQCGTYLHREASVGAVALNAAKYLPTAEEREAELQQLPVCRKCGGSGVCAVCRGGKGQSCSWWTPAQLWHAFLDASLTGWNRFSSGWSLLAGSVIDESAGGEQLINPASSPHCAGCNGNGRCYTCRGLGRTAETH